jgi:hypothetical protein
MVIAKLTKDKGYLMEKVEVRKRQVEVGAGY